MDEDKEFENAIKERFLQLPPVVQQAIISADISKKLRDLASTHNLHVDQWGTLENEVRMTLLGIDAAENLAENLKQRLNMPANAAEALATDISQTVFAPVRQELERQLEHPAAVAEKTTGVEDMRAQMLADAAHGAPAAATQAPALASAPAVAPGTPPPAPPTTQVERAPVSPSYQPATPSHERKTVEGDPYREQVN